MLAGLIDVNMSLDCGRKYLKITHVCTVSAQRKTPATQEVQGGQNYSFYQGVIVVLTEKTRM